MQYARLIYETEPELARRGVAEEHDAALEWATRCPCAETGRVEVRPTGIEQVT